ncbi:hypothetical protein [Pseudoalteromonas luteoviolacea]|uniref:Uncharacterized protein n=1 Tax=Pseudoalteromonas luteoviolacea S4054 TaxID=1129367 RepID=A0A0F6AI78_9GAMM|nr:hypothetical protein [Pseudoalteromonas luteoviolacea]AOT07706.1 hypothetical protein S4054249_07540 [Pseudoalteromonas luteoviolacea]AOT12622.1 hypothetical protein S40542_07540 [Pseudoalteromonas luteoviolacea]AOT17536.1 hypothetical protein S4054_07540 [Pseudoalteromonas luteoviolacea]KKE85501.1 hypothetical protein N479_25715 [Pseudoalteromonas luteoviolacea S4054]KZN75537.1 hypothetical protein N481_26495 [Pseudoalteromonas luteoviolacea S4047-1]
MNLNNLLYYHHKLSDFFLPLIDDAKARKNQLLERGISSYMLLDDAYKYLIDDFKLDESAHQKYKIEDTKVRASMGGYTSPFINELELRCKDKYKESKDPLDLVSSELQKKIRSISQSEHYTDWYQKTLIDYEEMLHRSGVVFLEGYDKKFCKDNIIKLLSETRLEAYGFTYDRSLSNKKVHIISKHLTDYYKVCLIFRENKNCFRGVGITSHFGIINNSNRGAKTNIPKSLVQFELWNFFGILSAPFVELYNYCIDESDLLYIVYVNLIMFEILFEDISVNKLEGIVHNTFSV